MNYRPPNKENWKGRQTDPQMGPQYWYQNIELKSIKELNLGPDLDVNVGIFGYDCDEGVRRNQGRVGAGSSPTLLRQRLSTLAYHHDHINVGDFGDVLCEDGDLELCQSSFSEAITALLEKQITPIAIGGGHDIAYGHFMGIWDAVKNTSKKKIGIINFDAHFDLRPVKESGNSGTPFNQVLSQYSEYVEYFPIGIQKPSNSKELYNIAKHFKVSFIESDQCTISNLENVKTQLDSFIERNDWVYITIDMDGFSSAFAPGVSAPSPMGFSPSFVFKLLEYISRSGKVISYDIAEINSYYDQDNATMNLGARIVDYITRNCSINKN